MKLGTSSDDPSVSVVVTTYERPKLCKRAIRSVAAQTHDPDEVIVVEDASETGIDDWLEAEFPSVMYISHETNRGLAAARNTGLSIATGEYIAYLDDDDEWKRQRLQQSLTVVNRLSEDERKKVGVVSCGIERQTPDGDVLSIALPKNEGELATSIQSVGATTYPSSFLFQRAALDDIGGFDESLSSSIDHDIWMQLAVAGYEARRVMEPLVVTYVSSRKQMTSNTTRRIEGVRQYVEKWKPIYSDWFGDNGGSVYADRYFARVIARLAATNLVSGDVAGFLLASQAIFEYSDETAFNFSILVRTVARRSLSEALPKTVKDHLKQWLK